MITPQKINNNPVYSKSHFSSKCYSFLISSTEKCQTSILKCQTFEELLIIWSSHSWNKVGAPHPSLKASNAWCHRYCVWSSGQNIDFFFFPDTFDSRLLRKSSGFFHQLSLLKMSEKENQKKKKKKKGKPDPLTANPQAALSVKCPSHYDLKVSL